MTERKRLSGIEFPTPPPPKAPRRVPASSEEAADTTMAVPPRRSSDTPSKAATKAPVRKGPTVVPARIPASLYDELVVHVARQEQLGGRPSYAQVVTWECESSGEAIVQDAIASVIAALPDRHAPRGRRPAASSTTAISFRFFPDELEIVNGLQDRLRAALGPELASRATRTAIIIAALSRALRAEFLDRPPSVESTDHNSGEK